MQARDLPLGARFTLPADQPQVVYRRVMLCTNSTVESRERTCILALDERIFNVLYIPAGSEVVVYKGEK